MIAPGDVVDLQTTETSRVDPISGEHDEDLHR